MKKAWVDKFGVVYSTKCEECVRGENLVGRPVDCKVWEYSNSQAPGKCNWCLGRNRVCSLSPAGPFFGELNSW